MGKEITLPLLGIHSSVAGGLYKSVARAESVGATTMQIFTKSGRSWFGKPIPAEEVTMFKEAMAKSRLSHVMTHASYLINLASSKPELSKKSIAGLKHELHRCEELGIPYLILHPGAHTGAGIEQGLENISKNLSTVLKEADGTTAILLETSAGQGTSLGRTFQELEIIYKNCTEKQYLGICLDTCHIFSAGYDISTQKGYEETLLEFEKVIGISKLKAIHLNDSKTPFSSHKDRHESIGKGSIPLLLFHLLMNDARLLNIPKILETPDPDLYEAEIKQLSGMIEKDRK